MTTVTRIQAGQYSVSDGRYIIKNGSSWYILTSEQEVEFGPMSTLTSAKQYIIDGTTLTGQHNGYSKHSQRQNKKEFNAYLASETKNGNPSPAILYILALVAVCIFVLVVRGY